jgi:hypothetical protein
MGGTKHSDWHSVSRSQHNAYFKWHSVLVPRHEIYHSARHDCLFSAAMPIFRRTTFVYSLPRCLTFDARTKLYFFTAIPAAILSAC